MKTSMLLLSAIIGASSLNEKREAFSHPAFLTSHELHGFPSDHGRPFFDRPGINPIVPYPTDIIKRYHIEPPFPHGYGIYGQNVLHLDDNFQRFYHENQHVPRAFRHPIRPFHGDVQDLKRFHNSIHPLARNQIYPSPPKRFLDILHFHQKEFAGKYSSPSDQGYLSHTLRNFNDLLEPIKQIYNNPKVKERIPPSQVLIYDKPFHRLYPILGHHHRHSGFTENEYLLDPISELTHPIDHSPDLSYHSPRLPHGLDTLPIEDREIDSDNTFLGDIIKPYAQSEYAAIAVHPSGGTSFVKDRRIGKREAKLIPESEPFAEKTLSAKENLTAEFLPAEHRSLDDGSFDLPGTTPFDNQFGGLSDNGPVVKSEIPVVPQNNFKEKLPDSKNMDDLGRTVHGINQEQHQGGQTGPTSNHQTGQMIQDKNIKSSIMQGAEIGTATLSVPHNSISSMIPVVRPGLKHLTSNAAPDVHTLDSKRSASKHHRDPILNSSYASVPADDPRGRNLDSSYASVPTEDLVFNPQFDHGQDSGGIVTLNSTYASVPTEHPDDINRKSYISGQDKDSVSEQMNQVNYNNVKKSYRYDITHSIIATIPEVQVKSRIELPEIDHISSFIPSNDVILSQRPLLKPSVTHQNVYEPRMIPLEEELGIHQSLLRADYGIDPTSSHVGNYGIGPVHTVRKNSSLDTTAIPLLQDRAIQTIPYQKVSHDTPDYSLRGKTPSKTNTFNHNTNALQREKPKERPNAAYHVTKPNKIHRNSFPTPPAFHSSFPLNSGLSLPYSIKPRLGYSTNRIIPRVQLLVHDGKTGNLNSPFNIRNPIIRKAPHRTGLRIRTKGLTQDYKTPALRTKPKPRFGRRRHQRTRIHRQQFRPRARAIPKRPQTKSRVALINREELLPILQRPSYTGRIYNPYLYYGLY